MIDDKHIEYAEVGNEATLDTLAASFTLSVSDTDPDTRIYLTYYDYAKVISYLFQVPLRKLDRSSYPWRCRFTAEDVEKIQAQVVGTDMSSLADGWIHLGTFLLLANSPRFPYTMHVSRARWDSNVYTYYDFILKKDILAPEPMKEI
jgi:hypothetical protein